MILSVIPDSHVNNVWTITDDFFSTFFDRNADYFLYKTKIYNGKINRSYTIMHGKIFIVTQVSYCGN